MQDEKEKTIDEKQKIRYTRKEEDIGCSSDEQI